MPAAPPRAAAALLAAAAAAGAAAVPPDAWDSAQLLRRLGVSRRDAVADAEKKRAPTLLDAAAERRHHPFSLARRDALLGAEKSAAKRPPTLRDAARAGRAAPLPGAAAVGELTAAECAQIGPGPTGVELLGGSKAPCWHMAAECLDALPLTSLKMLPRRCWQQLPPDAIAVLDASKVASLTEEVLSATKPAQLAALQRGCGGLNGEAMESMSRSKCRALGPACTSSIGKEATGLSPECVLALSPAAFGALNPLALSLLPHDAFCRISREHLHALPPTTCSALTKTQAGKISLAACAGLSAECLRWMPQGSRDALVNGCDPDAVRPGPLEPTVCDHAGWDRARVAAKERRDKVDEDVKRVREGKPRKEQAGTLLHVPPKTVAWGGRYVRGEVKAAVAESTTGAGSSGTTSATLFPFAAAAAAAAAVAVATVRATTCRRRHSGDASAEPLL